jgi:hypothetical protein
VSTLCINKKNKFRVLVATPEGKSTFEEGDIKIEHKWGGRVSTDVQSCLLGYTAV